EAPCRVRIRLVLTLQVRLRAREAVLGVGKRVLEVRRLDARQLLAGGELLAERHGYRGETTGAAEVEARLPRGVDRARDRDRLREARPRGLRRAVRDRRGARVATEDHGPAADDDRGQDDRQDATRPGRDHASHGRHRQARSGHVVTPSLMRRAVTPEPSAYATNPASAIAPS